VIELSQEFHWPHGPKRVYLHPAHVGLVGQWRTVNSVSGTSDEVISIVLEDDVVVSSYFFIWLFRAVDSYYTPHQRGLHHQLVTVIQKDIERSEMNNLSTASTSHVDQFYRDHAGRGEPLIFGISLAKQTGDIAHTPVDLEIRNQNSPFLFRYSNSHPLLSPLSDWLTSLVGTWGTVIFPMAWKAFVLWWNHRQSMPSYSPLIDDDFTTNRYYLDNPKIWSPWMIK
jgi:hypothetical protein